MTKLPDEKETLAQQRYLLMNGLRIGSLAAVLVGIAISRKVIDAPIAIAVVLAVGGLLGFFFGPRLLARKWKSGGDGSQ
ncbi:hypothetical protein ACI5KX_13140 [Erythrobacter sp. GH1-10]|uniref:hypothetical protein n=1 Tax=Erythrobacter sp. GH1-10 TaxID=3349334 RepID=UPI003877E11F